MGALEGRQSQGTSTVEQHSELVGMETESRGKKPLTAASSHRCYRYTRGTAIAAATANTGAAAAAAAAAGPPHTHPEKTHPCVERLTAKEGGPAEACMGCVRCVTHVGGWLP